MEVHQNEVYILQLALQETLPLRITLPRYQLTPSDSEFEAVLKASITETYVTFSKLKAEVWNALSLHIWTSSIPF